MTDELLLRWYVSNCWFNVYLFLSLAIVCVGTTCLSYVKAKKRYFDSPWCLPLIFAPMFTVFFAGCCFGNIYALTLTPDIMLIDAMKSFQRH